MDGYNAMLRILRENPVYIPLVKRCIEAHRTQMQKPCSLGFEWSDVGIQPVRLMRLATDYGILTVSYKSNSATCYMVKDLDGVVKALDEIEADRNNHTRQGRDGAPGVVVCGHPQKAQRLHRKRPAGRMGCRESGDRTGIEHVS